MLRLPGPGVSESGQDAPRAGRPSDATVLSANPARAGGATAACRARTLSDRFDGPLLEPLPGLPCHDAADRRGRRRLRPAPRHRPRRSPCAICQRAIHAITSAKPERAWNALTATGVPLDYLYGMTADTDWQPGARVTMALADHWRLTGEVLAAERPRRLSYTLDDPPGSPSVYVTWELRRTGDGTIIRLNVDEPWPLAGTLRPVRVTWWTREVARRANQAMPAAAHHRASASRTPGKTRVTRVTATPGRHPEMAGQRQEPGGTVSVTAPTLAVRAPSVDFKPQGPGGHGRIDEMHRLWRVGAGGLAVDARSREDLPQLRRGTIAV